MEKRTILITNARVNMGFQEFFLDEERKLVMLMAPPRKNPTDNEVPMRKLIIYDHRPATLEFARQLVKQPKTVQLGSKHYRASAGQAGVICCHARVLVEEKKLGAEYLPYLNLYPLAEADEPTALLTIREYPERQGWGATEFRLVENKALWSWVVNRLSRSKASSKVVIVALTNSYATLTVSLRHSQFVQAAPEVFSHRLSWENAV